MEVQQNNILSEMAVHHFENVTVMGVTTASHVYVNGSQHASFTYSVDLKVILILFEFPIPYSRFHCIKI